MRLVANEQALSWFILEELAIEELFLQGSGESENGISQICNSEKYR
jgi:hypothetical protein